MTDRPMMPVAYIGPKFEETAESSCQALLAEFERIGNIKLHFHHEIQSLLTDLADPRYQADTVSIDLEYLHSLEGSSMFDVIRSIDVLSKVNGKKIQIKGVVGHDTDPDLIRESLQVPEIKTLAMRMGGPWTFEMAVEDMHRHLRNDYTLPDAIKQLIKTPKKKSKTSIILTPRQSQIMELITTRGASNKIIAKTLKISESTVKLHMSAILKKYGCRNRTQLAVFSQRCRSTDKTPA